MRDSHGNIVASEEAVKDAMHDASNIGAKAAFDVIVSVIDGAAGMLERSSPTDVSQLVANKVAAVHYRNLAADLRKNKCRILERVKL